MSQPFDLVILGGGPGGYVAAVRASQIGLRTALVEKQQEMGGTCLHWGCIPTKVLLHAAEMIENIPRMKQYGIEVKEYAFDWKTLLRRKRAVVQKNAKGVQYLMKKGKVEVIHGFGFIEAPGRIRVTSETGESSTVEGKSILIATGSEVATIPGAELDGKRVLSSDDALKMEEIPRSIVVLGGGAVGVEFASLFRSFGAEVTLVEMLPALLPFADREVSEELARAFKKRGIDVRVGARFSGLDNRGESLGVEIEKEGGERETVSAVCLLVAVGRRPVTDGIGLDELGVAREKGYIQVSPRMETSVPGVYAIGDVLPTAALAHLASQEGIVAVEAIAGRDVETINYHHVPSCVYSMPEVASVGLTEEEAAASGRKTVAGRFPFSANAKAAVVADTTGFVKIITEGRYGEILGVHMIGHHVTELLSGVTTLMHAEGGVQEIGGSMHPHPTLSEAIREAALAAGEGAIHM